MRKVIRKEVPKVGLVGFEPGFMANVENFKRRRALQSFWAIDMSSKMFFERALHVRRGTEFVFITKAQSKNR